MMPAMGFVKVKGLDSLVLDANKQLQMSEQLILANLQYIGEQAVREARINGNYIDRTGNLRSSIGYVVLKDGKPIGHGYSDTDKHDGRQHADALLDKLAAELPKGYALVVCAGMAYASYVEDIHGRDVLTSARLLAEDLAKRLIK